MFYESLRIGYVSIENDLALYIQILKKKKKKKKKNQLEKYNPKGFLIFKVSKILLFLNGIGQEILGR
jgi:hypothetical protein